MLDSPSKKALSRYAYILIGFLCFALEVVINPLQPFLSGVFMILFAAFLYFWIVFLVANKNWLDIRAVFTAAWMGTIGLAALRLTGYQEQWQSITWMLLGLAYITFQIGATLGIHCGKKWYPGMCNGVGRFHIGKLRFSLHPGRLFPTCVIVTLIGLACFVINILIKGFIPCFSSSQFAYMDFYTKFHVFAVASCSISGLCYYCIKTQPLRIWQKIVLYLCILYTVFIFPIMVVSRGVFVVSAVALTVSVFYLGKKRFLTLVLCLATILGVYWGCSQLRNYTEGQLSELFEPISIDLTNNPTDPTENTDLTETTDPTETTESEDTSASTGTPGETDIPTVPNTGATFQLSPKMAFLYGYLTVSHDNFNEAVQNNNTYSYGLRQLSPFNVILRSSWLSEKIGEGETYLVRPHLNTTNLIGDFYYDFGGWGIAFCMLLWAFLFGINQSAYEAGNNPFILLFLGNTMVPIALCFFSVWLSIFNHWLLWGSVLLFALGCCITIQPKEKA